MIKMSEKSFVDLEEHAKKEAEKKMVKPTTTEMAIQSIAISFIKIAEAIERIAKALEKSPLPSPSLKTPSKTPSSIVSEISLKFPENLRKLLEYKQEGDKIIIKPKAFLGSENFARILEIVRNNNGRYVSDGKNSRFEIPINN